MRTLMPLPANLSIKKSKNLRNIFNFVYHVCYTRNNVQHGRQSCCRPASFRLLRAAIFLPRVSESAQPASQPQQMHSQMPQNLLQGYIQILPLYIQLQSNYSVTTSAPIAIWKTTCSSVLTLLAFHYRPVLNRSNMFIPRVLQHLRGTFPSLYLPTCYSFTSLASSDSIVALLHSIIHKSSFPMAHAIIFQSPSLLFSGNRIQRYPQASWKLHWIIPRERLVHL